MATKPRQVPNRTGKWMVQTGKGKGRYNTTFTFATYTQAMRHYNCLNIHSGYKKRLVNPLGTIVGRLIT